jgi:hypothetical protein
MPIEHIFQGHWGQIRVSCRKHMFWIAEIVCTSETSISIWIRGATYLEVIDCPTRVSARSENLSRQVVMRRKILVGVRQPCPPASAILAHGMCYSPFTTMGFVDHLELSLLKASWAIRSPSSDYFCCQLFKKFCALPLFVLTLNGMSLKVTIKHEAGVFYPPQWFINRKYFHQIWVYTSWSNG